MRDSTDIVLPVIVVVRLGMVGGGPGFTGNTKDVGR